MIQLKPPFENREEFERPKIQNYQSKNGHLVHVMMRVSPLLCLLGLLGLLSLSPMVDAAKSPKAKAPKVPKPPNSSDRKSFPRFSICCRRGLGNS